MLEQGNRASDGAGESRALAREDQRLGRVQGDRHWPTIYIRAWRAASPLMPIAR